MRSTPPADDLNAADIEGNLRRLATDRSVPRSRRFKGGTKEARARLEQFLAERLEGHCDGGNEPAAQQSSGLSPCLHFGQISPVEVALACAAARLPGDPDRGVFLEELIVRRELSHNFVTYNPAYDSFEGLPRWTKETLDKHRNDRPRASLKF